MTVVLDASAVLAFFWSEPGSEVVAEVVGDSAISAVNLAEVYTKLVDRGIGEEAIRRMLADLPCRVAAFDEVQSLRVGELRRATRRIGLSIGDRACLSLAELENAAVLTADRAWAGLDSGVPVRLIR